MVKINSGSDSGVLTGASDYQSQFAQEGAAEIPFVLSRKTHGQTNYFIWLLQGSD